MISQSFLRRIKETKQVYNDWIKCYPFTLDDLPDEIWKEFYSGYYLSNYGRMMSFKRGKQRIIKPLLVGVYLAFYLYIDGKDRIFKIHRLVAQLFIPNPKGKPQVNHIDGIKFNNHVSNLEWVTQSENVRHAYDNGLITLPVGQEHPQAKLTAEQVEFIRANPDNLTTTELGKIFGIKQTTISNIQLGKIWKCAGGSVRDKKKGGKPPVPSDIRQQIKAEYVWRSSEHGSCALAKKYGISSSTVLCIVHEG